MLVKFCPFQSSLYCVLEWSGGKYAYASAHYTIFLYLHYAGFMAWAGVTGVA